MKVYLIVLTLTLSLVRRGNTQMKTPVYSAAEGEDLNVRCFTYRERSSMLFCKNDCNRPKNILFDSENATLDSRYSFVPGHFDMMYVRIKNVSSSDSGTYVCIQRAWKNESELWEFVLSVTTGYDVTPDCPTQSGPRHHCWLMFSVAMVLTSVLVLWIYWRKKAQNENSRCPTTETAEYENMRAVSESADCIYHNLCVETIDLNQTYCSI